MELLVWVRKTWGTLCGVTVYKMTMKNSVLEISRY